MVRVWMGVAGAAALVAVVLATVALNVSWATVEGEDEGGYKALSAWTDALVVKVHFPYSDDIFDDADGIGMVRSGGVLWLVGTAVAGMGAILFQDALLTGRRAFHIAATVAVGLAFVVLVLGLVFLPIGLASLTDDPGVGDAGELQWGAGLVLAILAGLFALASAVVGLWALLRETGFRLEPADAAPASFD